MKRLVCLALAMLLLALCAAPVLAEGWSCTSCGAANEGKFCGNCGAPRPEKPACPACGQELKPGKTYKFCPECGNEFAAPVTVNTPAPAKKPPVAPTSTPAPAERTFHIEEYNVRKDGTVIRWQDTAGRGPYTLYYELLLDHDYNSARQQATMRWLGGENIIGNSLELNHLVPGVAYWITVYDADGVMTKGKLTPMARAPFSEFNVKVTLQPRARQGTAVTDLAAFNAADILAGGKEYGAQIHLTYREQPEEKTYAALAAITCPDGYQFVETAEKGARMEAGSAGMDWSFYSFEKVFATVKDIYGGIPTGEYTWTLYLDTRPAANATFTVK